MYALIESVVLQDALHAKWLNTLSFMENAGARKISACEHSFYTGIIQLKHAAEEHRHAYYLKKQIANIMPGACATYTSEELLAPGMTRHYLQTLDIQACRYLKRSFRLTSSALKYAAYLFVTYAIELRADALYPVYQEVLSRLGHSVKVKSIIAEEEGHLEEMIAQLQQFSEDWATHAKAILDIEQSLFEDWISCMEKEVCYA